MHILSNEDSEEHWQLLEHIVQKLPQDDVHKMLKRRNAILETVSRPTGFLYTS